MQDRHDIRQILDVEKVRETVIELKSQQNSLSRGPAGWRVSYGDTYVRPQSATLQSRTI